jgi:hypothetical protein
MENHAKGEFKVTIVPQKELREVPMLARNTIDKTFSGDLEAISQGQMLAAGTVIKNSAGYVAIERVEGTLAGRKGSFILQHTATMNRGVPTLSISVVPDSGTEELTGINGTLSIDIKDGTHYYDFSYSLSVGM